MQVDLPEQHYKWNDKYRPRKPRFFAHHRTKNDWNRYNKALASHVLSLSFSLSLCVSNRPTTLATTRRRKSSPATTLSSFSPTSSTKPRCRVTFSRNSPETTLPTKVFSLSLSLSSSCSHSLMCVFAGMCRLRVHAGPPYEGIALFSSSRLASVVPSLFALFQDVAFAVVNKPWDKSSSRGGSLSTAFLFF